jgi:TonB family protein
MNRKTSVLFLAVLLIQAATARAESVKDALNHKYKKQVLALRSPLTAGNQKFDSAGHSLKSVPNSGWMIYGGIYVEKLNLSKDSLRLEGPRAAFIAEKKNGKPVLIRFSKSQRIEIHLDQPLESLEDAVAVMDRIFFITAEAPGHAWPELRRVGDNTPDDEIYHVSTPAFSGPNDKPPAVADRDKQDKVLPPRPTYTPEPEYSEEARHARYQGIVVMKILINKAGDVVRVRLERSLGLGLDEKAMEGVTRWRFTPATHNGQPVAVEMNIEVSFNLY